MKILKLPAWIEFEIVNTCLVEFLLWNLLSNKISIISSPLTHQPFIFHPWSVCNYLLQFLKAMWYLSILVCHFLENEIEKNSSFWLDFNFTYCIIIVYYLVDITPRCLHLWERLERYMISNVTFSFQNKNSIDYNWTYPLPLNTKS